ncbi:MAG: cysteine hydrolase [Granulosicoccus sp.]|nr:cysteine hydrolase [Granulosicoccus sp.]
MSSLPFGPLGQHSLMVCIDMQRLFLEPGEWYAPDALSILPACKRLAACSGEHCLFTRFITAYDSQDASGSWQRYYKRWSSVTRSIIGDDALNLHPDLQTFANETNCFDKRTHDAFDSSAFSEYIRSYNPSALVFFGIETDVCVLATALSAVDLGYRVIVVEDACASSEPNSHQACLAYIFPRFDQQIEITDSRTLLKEWQVS